jgi:hypothetical protein
LAPVFVAWAGSTAFGFSSPPVCASPPRGGAAGDAAGAASPSLAAVAASS